MTTNSITRTLGLMYLHTSLSGDSRINCRLRSVGCGPGVEFLRKIGFVKADEVDGVPKNSDR